MAGHGILEQVPEPSTSTEPAPEVHLVREGIFEGTLQVTAGEESVSTGFVYRVVQFGIPIIDAVQASPGTGEPNLPFEFHAEFRTVAPVTQYEWYFRSAA